MTYTTLVTTQELAQHLSDSNWAVIDCRFSLTDPDRGEKDYRQSHIPGAAYAHLDRDLSAQVILGVTGRHPWLSHEAATSLFSSLGIDQDVQVVAYDDAGGALAAVRVWWMLRWLSHTKVAILDGGWQKWIVEGLPSLPGNEIRLPRKFVGLPRPEMFISTQQVEQFRLDPSYLILDARANDRYHGKNETIDPVAGHIPGAVNAPYMDNLAPDGTLRPADELRQLYSGLLGKIPAEKAVFYCGSGVTSILNLLALYHAGLGEGRLYAGSWSEWITDRKRPVAD